MALILRSLLSAKLLFGSLIFKTPGFYSADYSPQA